MNDIFNIKANSIIVKTLSINPENNSIFGIFRIDGFDKVFSISTDNHNSQNISYSDLFGNLYSDIKVSDNFDKIFIDLINYTGLADVYNNLANNGLLENHFVEIKNENSDKPYGTDDFGYKIFDISVDKSYFGGVSISYDGINFYDKINYPVEIQNQVGFALSDIINTDTQLTGFYDSISEKGIYCDIPFQDEIVYHHVATDVVAVCEVPQQDYFEYQPSKPDMLVSCHFADYSTHYTANQVDYLFA